MSKAEDINTLFRRFGGNAETYQEIVEGELAGAAEQKWPMLGQLRPQAHREAPATRKGAVAVGERQVHAFMDPPRYAAAPATEPVAIIPMVPAHEVLVTPPAVVPADASVPLQTTVPVAVAASVGAVERSSRVEKPVVHVASAVGRSPLSALFGRAAVASVAHAEMAQPLQQPVMSVSVATPVALQQVAVAERLDARVQPAASVVSEPGESNLRTLFNRLVPPKVEPPAAQPAAPLKRLVKW